MKLKTKIILFFATFIVSLTAVMFIYFTDFVRGSFKDEIDKNLRIVVETNEETYIGFINGLKARALDWSSDRYIKELSESILNTSLSHSLHTETVNDFVAYVNEKRIPYATDILIADILDRNGIVVASSRPKRIGIDEYKEEMTNKSHYFSKTITAEFGEVFMRSAVFEEDETDDPMFHATVRLFSTKVDAHGKFIPLQGVLLVHFISLPQLSDLISNIKKYVTDIPSVSNDTARHSFETYVVNRDNIIVASTHKDSEEDLKKNESAISPLTGACFSRGEEGSAEYKNYDGSLVVGAVTCLFDEGVAIVVEKNYQDAYAIYNALFSKTAIWAAFFFLLSVAMIILTVRRPLFNIASIATVAAKVSRGNLSVRNTVNSRDEIGYLAQIFNTMLDTIVDSNKKMTGQTLLLKEDIKRHEEQEKFITESKRATLNLLEDAWETKESLEVEKNRLNTVISSIGDGLILIDAQHKIALVNPKAAEIFIIPREELIGKDLRTVMKLWIKRTKELATAEWPTTEMFLKKTVVLVDMEDNLSLTTDKRTDKLPVALSIAPLGGGLAGAVIVIRDVTEDRALDDAKSGFISVASHQLRTPLTTIRWYSEMLLSGDAGDLSVSQRDFLNEIHGGAERLYQTIDLLLGISRIESGKMKSEKTPINLTATTEDVVKELRPQIDLKKIIFTIIPPEGDAVTVILDSIMLRQVMLNLFSNSIRYTDEYGAIEARWSMNESKDEVTYSVHDNGIGIPESQRGRIFSKFFRAENALSKAPDGSGLGLALVKELVESWGGKVWFETTDGHGTTFYFTIPIS